MDGKPKSAARQETRHRMGRRCFAWDYASRCIYLITVTLADRSRPTLGKLVRAGEEWAVAPSETGRIVEECWRGISRQWPGVETLASQLMPDHFHGVIFVKEPQKKKLGNIVGSFKSRSASLVARRQPCDVASRLWAPGYVDVILFRKGQLEKMIAYVRDNPRRLGVKRAHPALFTVARDFRVDFAARGEARDCQQGLSSAPARAPGRVGHFVALGNHFLLDWPDIHQIQCSRSFFAYRRERLPGGWRICRDAAGKPIVEITTPRFAEIEEKALAAAARGAVLISPCLSHGEREIARRAFEAGYRVIVLRHMGFPPL